MLIGGSRAGAAVLIRIRAQASEPFADVQLLVQDSVWGMGDGLSVRDQSIKWGWGMGMEMGMMMGPGSSQSINQVNATRVQVACTERNRAEQRMAWHGEFWSYC